MGNRLTTTPLTSTPLTTTPLTLLHFNDVYNIEARVQEPVGGAARLSAAFKARRHLRPLVLFSGDVFSPSFMSAITRGKQMVPVLNALGVHCAVYGNHEFDFGVDVLEELAGQCQFPWLLSNVYDDLNDKNLGNGLRSRIITWQGKKLGLMGLVEKEWLNQLSTVDPEGITYTDFVDAGRLVAAELKQQGADYIIALTHMHWEADVRLAEEVGDIDLILGGHDHMYGVKQVNGKMIIKSGTDFQEFSEITLTFGADKPEVHVVRVVVDTTLEPDPEVKSIVQGFVNELDVHLAEVLGRVDVVLDGINEHVRRRETNLGNLIADVMLNVTDADCAMVNAGALRPNRMHPRGQLTVRDLMSIVPINDNLVVVKLTGEQMLQALEVAVAKYPAAAGSFLQVSGVSFQFDPRQPRNYRIVRGSVTVQGSVIDPQREYRVCTVDFIARGKDGFEVFADGKVVVNSELPLRTALRNHFRSLSLLDAHGDCAEAGTHRQRLVSVFRRKMAMSKVVQQYRASPTASEGAEDNTQHQDKPDTDQSEPAETPDQPDTDQSEPAVTPDKPDTDQSEPAVTPDKPDTDQSEPAVTPDQPDTDQSEPAETPDQPDTDQSEPAETPDQPDTDQSEPAVTPEQHDDVSELDAVENADPVVVNTEEEEVRRSRLRKLKMSLELTTTTRLHEAPSNGGKRWQALTKWRRLVTDMEKDKMAALLAPSVEGRIVNIRLCQCSHC